MTCRPGPCQLVPAIGMPLGSRSAGMAARQAMQPVNCGRPAPNTPARTAECTPSAPIEQPAARRAAVAQMQEDLTRGLLHADAGGAELDRIGLHWRTASASTRCRVAPVHEQVGRAISLGRNGAKVEKLPRAPCLPVPDHLRLGLDRACAQRRLEPQRVQDPRAVGADLHARADLAQLGCLLVHTDVDAATQQRQRGREAADARADNDHRIA